MARVGPRAVVAPADPHHTAPRWAWGLVLAAVLPIVYWYFGRADAIGVLAQTGSWLRVSGPVLSGPASFGLAFGLLGVVPALLTPLVFGCAPWHLGLGAGRVREGLAWAAVGVAAGIFVGWSSASSPGLAAVYPLGAPTLAAGVFAIHAIGYLLYYAGFEYLFRGFLLLGTERPLGAWPANLLQAAIVTLAHLGKPPIELAVAFPASVLFGWIVLRTRSIWYVVAIHWAVGLSLDYFLLTR